MIITKRLTKKMKRKEKFKNWLFSRKKKIVVKELQRRALKQLTYKIVIQAEDFNMSVEDLEFILKGLQKQGEIKLCIKEGNYLVEIVKQESKPIMWQVEEVELKVEEVSKEKTEQDDKEANNPAVAKLLADTQETLKF